MFGFNSMLCILDLNMHLVIASAGDIGVSAFTLH